MRARGNWRKSSYSGEGDGNECVEVANSTTHVAVRDSKAPSYGTLTVPTEVFATFLGGIKRAETEW
ncbi:DUF397 domain-containing protein [Streptomyces sp. MH60]|uniref:DUF397 domain-containing protein n=1 Tax=Streptomyces sp. MH60 TaxID=1940758 RepID=UPI000CEE14F2|nr:DUF397 domain-containing protein [Streptomyces sp. MH60]PPS88402.1 hypothetical protein BZZ08_02274 [Streptomyces sp. MH60]